LKGWAAEHLRGSCCLYHDLTCIVVMKNCKLYDFRNWSYQKTFTENVVRDGEVMKKEMKGMGLGR